MKSMICYYSRAGENYFDGSYKIVEKGNTEKIAEYMQELTGADIFQIEQKVPYSDSYMECVKQAREDLKNNVRPELTGLPEHFEDYDVIYLGFPSYCGTIPMAVFTFLESLDFEGKTIKPFCSNEGSGMGNSVADIMSCCKNAEVKAGLSIHASNLDEDKMKAWI